MFVFFNDSSFHFESTREISRPVSYVFFQNSKPNQKKLLPNIKNIKINFINFFPKALEEL